MKSTAGSLKLSEMYNAYYNSLKDLLKLIPELKEFDWFNDQYSRYEELKPNLFPAVYIEFQNPLIWQDGGNGLQVAENTNINIHIVQFGLKDEPSDEMDIASIVFKKVNGQSLKDANGDDLSTPLTRSSSELITKFDQLKVIIISFRTALYDKSAMKQLVPANPTLKVERQ